MSVRRQISIIFVYKIDGVLTLFLFSLFRYLNNNNIKGLSRMSLKNLPELTKL